MCNHNIYYVQEQETWYMWTDCEHTYNLCKKYSFQMNN
jgi:hypothetical protein